jgi:hypothetical protein
VVDRVHTGLAGGCPNVFVAACIVGLSDAVWNYSELLRRTRKLESRRTAITVVLTAPKDGVPKRREAGARSYRRRHPCRCGAVGLLVCQLVRLARPRTPSDRSSPGSRPP